MSRHAYTIAFAFAHRDGTEERTLQLTDDEAEWFRRSFDGCARLEHFGRCAEIRPAGTPPSPNLQAPAEPVTRATKRTRRRSRPTIGRTFDLGGAA